MFDFAPSVLDYAIRCLVGYLWLAIVFFSIAPLPFFKMKYCTVAITLFCSVSRSRSLEAGDDNVTPDGYAETLLRQLKAMPPAKCTCQDEYTLRDGMCVRSVEVEPQVNGF